MLRALSGGLLDLLAPPVCPGCALAWQPTLSPFCPACEPLIERAPSRLQPPARVAAVLSYQGPIADAIRRFKYACDSTLAGSLARLLVPAAHGYAGSVDAVVPMPLHPRKLRERGWNPSLLLAKPVASALGIPLQVGWLTRRRATRSQAGLSSTVRRENVRGAFSACDAPAQRILLIDDVMTTGATLCEASDTLQACGHDVITLALAWSPDDRS
jgi:ComF family protein